MKTDRAIRFIRPWHGRMVGAIGTPGEFGYGQRHTLVAYNFAKWVDDEPVRPKQKRQLQRETSE